MKYLSLLWRINWRVLAAGLSAIAVLHIGVTFASPFLSPTKGYDRLANTLALNTMTVLAPISAKDQPLPFFGADGRVALCRFNSEDGIVSVTANLPGPGWLLAIYAPNGDNVFTAVAAPGRVTDIALTLVPGGEAPQGTDSAQRSSASEDQTLRLTASSGIVMVRAPEQGEAYRVRNLAELKRASCSYRTVKS